MQIILSILVLLIALLSYLLYINYRRAESAEQYCEAYIKFVSIMFLKFKATRDHMKEIDRLGAFQADDEVGSIFREMDESIKDLYDFITKYVNTESEETEKTKN